MVEPTVLESANRAVRAVSFGGVAAAYDRYRPSPPQTAIDWLLPQSVAVAVDLAAGTGALARRLLGHAGRVIAVEPDERMAAVLARRLPQVDLLIGRALYIFWPHSWDRIDIGSWHVWCPFFPNFGRMRFVR